MKLNPSNWHLLKMNSIRGFSRALLWLIWIFRTPILENTCWWLLLFVLEALVFANTLKWMLSSLSNQAIFFLQYFYLKDHPKNMYLHSNFHEDREFHHCFSSCFHHSLSNSNYFASAKKCWRKSCIIDFKSAKIEFTSAIFKKLYFSKYLIKRCCKQLLFVVWLYKQVL